MAAAMSGARVTSEARSCSGHAYVRPSTARGGRPLVGCRQGDPQCRAEPVPGSSPDQRVVREVVDDHDVVARHRVQKILSDVHCARCRARPCPGCPGCLLPQAHDGHVGPSACPASATTPVRTSSSEIALLICRAMSRTCRFPPEARVGAEVDLRFADLFLGLGASRFPLAGMPDRVRSSDVDIGIAGALNQVGHSSINQVGHSVARSSSDRDPHAEADGQGHEDHRAVRVPRAVLGDRAQEHPEQRRVP